jgi:hypothetical protein
MMVRGKMMPFSVVSLVGPDMFESAYFWSVSGVVNISFIDCHLVMGQGYHCHILFLKSLPCFVRIFKLIFLLLLLS